MQFYQKIKKKLKKIFDFYQKFCYNKIIENLTQNDVTELVEDGILPEKLLSIIDENFQTGTFKSKKWGIKLGTIYDIIDKDFNKTEEIEE